MRIVNLDTFLAMPKGTMYQKCAPCYFEHLVIFAGRCGDIDFFSDDALTIPIPPDLITPMYEMTESVPVEFANTGRDGCFARDQLFAIWEADDLRALITVAERALAIIT